MELFAEYESRRQELPEVYRMQKQERSKMLGTMPMNRLVPTVSVPIMVSMLVQALYNVVDSIFVARFDPYALTAVSLAYPIQMLMIALSVGMGVGINSLISRKLGAKQFDEAHKAAWNGILVELCGYVIMLMIGLFAARAALNGLVSESLQNYERIREMGTTYLTIVTTCSFGLFMSICFERMLQSTGNTMLSMATQLCGALTNIILDPILIFGLFGAPSLGIAGAAIATVIGQIVSMTVGFTLNQLRNAELRLKVSEFSVDAGILRGIVAVGLPSTVMQAIGSVMNVGMNGLLSGFAEGNAAVNVLNVYFKLQSFIFMPVFGLGNGMVAIVGYNFGAHLKERVYEAIKVALKYALVILAVGMLLFLVLPEQLMSLFESDGDAEIIASMTSIGVAALRTICLHFLLAGVGITLGNVFQALGKGIYSLIVSLCRQMVVLLPAAWLLAQTGHVNAVWWAFLIAEVVSAAISLLFFRKVDRTMLKTL